MKKKLVKKKFQVLNKNQQKKVKGGQDIIIVDMDQI